MLVLTVHFKNSFFCFLFLLFSLLLFFLLFSFFPSFSFLTPFMIFILTKFKRRNLQLQKKLVLDFLGFVGNIWGNVANRYTGFPNPTVIYSKKRHERSRASRGQILCYYIARHFNTLEDEEMASSGKWYSKEAQMFPLTEPTGLKLCAFHNWHSLYGPFPTNPRVSSGTLVTLKDLHLEPWDSEGEEIASMLTLFSTKNKEHHSVSDDLDSRLVPSWPGYLCLLVPLLSFQ